MEVKRKIRMDGRKEERKKESVNTPFKILQHFLG
jgi:hypothetical protein